MMEKQEEALQILRETLERGDWYEPDLLRRDPGFASLQELPAFREMVEICPQRQAGGPEQGATRIVGSTAHHPEGRAASRMGTDRRVQGTLASRFAKI